MRCVQFWYKMLTSRMYEESFLRYIGGITQAVECGKGSWISISKCVRRFGWQDVNDDVIRKLTDADMKSMLLSVAWRNAIDEWSGQSYS